jgi:hypothetical protein
MVALVAPDEGDEALPEHGMIVDDEKRDGPYHQKSPWELSMRHEIRVPGGSLSMRGSASAVAARCRMVVDAALLGEPIGDIGGSFQRDG